MDLKLLFGIILLIIGIALILWSIWKIHFISHIKRNCDNKDCPMNTLHESGKYNTCSIDVLSVVDGKCEFWEAYRESKRLDALAKRGIENVRM